MFIRRTPRHEQTQYKVGDVQRGARLARELRVKDARRGAASLPLPPRVHNSCSIDV